MANVILADRGGAIAIQRRIQRMLDLTVITIANGITVNLASAMPKDTTHAASNVLVGTSPPSTPVGSKKTPTWAPFYQALAALKGYKTQMGNVIISNAVHYVGRIDPVTGGPGLDGGWSPQAPAGFIGMTIRKTLRRAITLMGPIR